MRAFVIAMPNEAEAVRAALLPTDRLYLSGIGKVNAALATQRAIDAGATEIWNAGVAGGFGATMRVGEVYEIGRAVEYDFDLAQLNGTCVGQLNERETPYFELVSLPKHGSWLGAPQTLGSGDHFRDACEDEALFRELGVTVRDMEGAAIAHVCERNDVPCRILKAISNVQGQGSMTGQYKANVRAALQQLGEVLVRLLSASVEG